MEGKCIIKSFIDGELPQTERQSVTIEMCPENHCEVLAKVGRASVRDQIGFAEAENDTPLTSCNEGRLFSYARQQATLKNKH